MKNLRKSLVLVLSLALVSVMLIGCGKKELISPEESIKVFYNFTFKGERSNLEKIGVTQTQMDQIIESQKKIITTSIKTNFKSGDLKITDAQVEDIYNARCEALKKLSVTSEVIKKDDKEATIKVGTTYFKETELDEKAANDAIKTVTALKLTDEKQLKDKLANQYINNLIDAYKNISVSTDSKFKEFKFVLKDKIWQAENPSDFGFNLGKLAVGLN